MNILGISAFYHDSAAAIIQDGKILAAMQEERFTRIKHDANLPINAIHQCLLKSSLKLSDIDVIVYYEKPLLKFSRLLSTYISYGKGSYDNFCKAMQVWLKKKLWIKKLIRDELRYEGKIDFIEHHQSHAASAFYPSPFKEAAVLTMDGVGEWASSSIAYGKDHELDILYEQHYPHSLGLLYSAFTHYTGFKINSGEYKVMGLAPYGQPIYKELILDKLIDLKEDGSFKMNMDYFDFCTGFKMTNDKFARLFGGAARTAESDITQKEMDLASSIQEVVEEVMLKTASHVRQVTNSRQLCMAGGVALNCVANGKILRQKIFDKVWVQPASGDAGGALGAALFYWHHLLGNRKEIKNNQKGSYLGSSYNDSQVQSFLKEWQLPFKKLNNDELYCQTAQLLDEGNVIGWFSGAMEYGPRALGNRSIIGDPRNPQMQSTLNLKIKKRESFRPFAPAVLAEDRNKYFEIDQDSPYMLMVAQVNPNLCYKELSDTWGIDKLKQLRSSIPAITHVDYSARVQTVHQESNPEFHRLLSEFKKLTGCSVLVNTSFNVRGEPIVESPKDAYRCFRNTDMDYLVLGSYLLSKKQHAEIYIEEFKTVELELD